MEQFDISEFVCQLQNMHCRDVNVIASIVLNEILSRNDHGLIIKGNNGQEVWLDHVLDDTPDELYKNTEFEFANASKSWLGEYFK